MTDISKPDDYLEDKPEFFLRHFQHGTIHATFYTANAALACARGMDRTDYFYFTDAKGARVTFGDNPRAPGHAHAILDTLRRRDEMKG